jgi:hypothetical protein
MLETWYACGDFFEFDILNLRVYYIGLSKPVARVQNVAPGLVYGLAG